MKVMLKKLHEKELKKKIVANEVAKDNSQREYDSIKYDREYPLIVDSKTHILELSILPNIDDGDENLKYMKQIEGLMDKKEKNYRNVTRKVVRIRFKDMDKEYYNEDDEKNPYFVDINTVLSLEELEQKLMECNDEDDIYELND